MSIQFDHFQILSYPFKHGLSKTELPFTYEELLAAIEDEGLINANERNNQNFQKTEIRASNKNGIVKEVLSLMSSAEMTEVLSDAFGIASLSSDKSFDGGGLTITDTGGFLRYHADFPYSNLAKKYRVINCLLYLSSPDIHGGDLHLLDPTTRTVEAAIEPVWGRLLAFPTSKNTPHGFSRITSGRRISVNAYYYADYPLDDRFAPGKTEWL
jgi:Rps23 Pro-64 3,4-dihydroxylase Tpa1-like proline 4-hydroxylase